MTTFGIDISRYQADINLAAVSDGPTEFVIAKATEGMSWVDPEYARFRAGAEAHGFLFAAYHFLRGDSDPRAQAENVKNVVGNTKVPVVIDIERTNGAPQPRMSTVRAFKTAAEALGVVVSPLLYFPQWYWVEVDRPDVTGWDIWQSAYGANDGTYPGDLDDSWKSHGTVAEMLQFTSQGRVHGYPRDIDRNAFRGTREDLVQKGWLIDYKEEEVTPEQIQNAVRNTPIVIDEAGNTQTLQRVLRRVLNRPDPAFPDSATPDAIAKAVVAALPTQTTGLTQADVQHAVRTVLTEGVGGP